MAHSSGPSGRNYLDRLDAFCKWITICPWPHRYSLAKVRQPCTRVLHYSIPAMNLLRSSRSGSELWLDVCSPVSNPRPAGFCSPVVTLAIKTRHEYTGFGTWRISLELVQYYTSVYACFSRARRRQPRTQRERRCFNLVGGRPAGMAIAGVSDRPSLKQLKTPGNVYGGPHW